MKTITIQIGNSDDKLSQASWSEFVERARQLISVHSRVVHFFGALPKNPLKLKHLLGRLWTFWASSFMMNADAFHP